jgi:GNAT superfamily N-acetyltransferase
VAQYFTLDYVERVTLSDGTEVVVRLLQPDDKELLREGFSRLSPESRYARFLSPKTSLSDEELRYLCEIDQQTHFALGAVRESDGRGVGIARFIKIGDGVAEAAITVADDAQKRGLGKLLLLRLCSAAAERGIDHFRCEVLGSNTGMASLLAAIAPDRTVDVESGVMTIEIDVPHLKPTESVVAESLNPMYRLLRAAAQNAVEWTAAVRGLWRSK